MSITAGEKQQHVDFDQLAASVTIRDILVEAGFEPTTNRMACPIHGGDNRSSFRFSDFGYNCYACGAHGGLLDLIQALHGCNRKGALCRLRVLAGISRPIDSSHISRQMQFSPSRRRKWSREEFAKIERYEWLKLWREGVNCLLRILNRRARDGTIDPATYYIQEQICLHNLEESDADFILATYHCNRIKRGKRSNDFIS